MSKKDLYLGAEIVGNASSDKFTEVSKKLGEIQKDWRGFSARQGTINEALVNSADSHEERLQSLEDNRNFVRVSRHSLADMEPHEQEFLAGWLQTLALELKARGLASNSNQQAFLTNIFTLIGVRDILLQQRGGLETLENFGSSEFHEAVYKVFLVFCYLAGNSFEIVEQLEDIDRMFKLNEADKYRIRHLLETERIPALGVPGLVRMFDQSRPLDSFSVETLISRHLDISNHSLLATGLDNTSYSIYLKAFALLVPQSGAFTEKQRSFLSALATLFGCQDCIFELDELCIRPQNVDIRSWQALLDTDDKKYAWALDGAALLGLNPDFDPEKNDVIEQALKGIRLSDARDFIIAGTLLTRETNPAELYELIKKVNARCKGWKHIIEYCGSSLNGAFSDLRADLDRCSRKALALSWECTKLSMETMDNRYWLGGFGFESSAQKVMLALGGKLLKVSRASNVSDLRDFKKKTEAFLSDCREAVHKANAVLRVFGTHSIDLDGWFVDDCTFELDNSASNENWSDDYDRLSDKLATALQNAVDTTILLDSQLSLFEKGELYQSVLLSKQQQEKERAEQRQAELEAKRTARIGEGDAAQVISIAWRDIKELPFKPDNISAISSSGRSWMALVDHRELYRSDDGENWYAAEMPAGANYCQSIKYVHDTWILINSVREAYFSKDGEEWLCLMPPPNLESSKFDILFFDGKWLLQSTVQCEYTYTEIQKGIVWDSTTTNQSSYDVPVFYRSQSLQGPWEHWKEASNLTEGLTLATDSIGVRENVLTAALEYDYWYASRKNVHSRASRLSYITPEGWWQSATWPSDKVERITGRFYSWGKKSFFLGDGTLVASNNGYEWAVVDGATTVGEEFFDIGGVLFLPGRDGKIAQVSIDGTHFSELALSGAESGYWNHFATSDTAILATFSPSRHETFLRLGSIQMAPAG